MKSLLASIGKISPLILAGGAVLGMVLPGLGNIIEAGIPLLVTLLLTTAMIRVDFQQVIAHLRRPIYMGLILLFLMLVIPITVHSLAHLFNLTPTLHIGLVLLFCAPPLAASPSMAALLGLDDAMVLNIMVIGTLLVPLSASLLGGTMLNFPIDLDVGALFLRLSLIISISIITAFIIRHYTGRRWIAKNNDVLDGISALIMVVFAIVVMNGIGLSQGNYSWWIIKVFGIVCFANLGLHLLFSTICILLERFGNTAKFKVSKQNGAIALMAGNRNMALLLAALPPEIVESLLLFIALYQLPIYFTPILATPFYRRFLVR